MRRIAKCVHDVGERTEPGRRKVIPAQRTVVRTLAEFEVEVVFECFE